MEIAANIDETDIGRVKPGQSVSFTVNAYPARTFTGTVKQVRLGSQTVQNVVIYTTIISVENPRRELMPGMTANLRIETDRRDDVLRVPNAALRWRPPTATADASVTVTPETAPGRGSPRAEGSGLTDLIAAIEAELELDAEQARAIDAALAEARAALASGEPASGADVSERRERSRAIRSALENRIAAVLTADQRTKFDEIRQRLAETRRLGQTGRVFVLGPDGKPQVISLRLGATDGVMTEVISGNLQAGQEIIVGGGPRPETAITQRPTFGPRFGL
jgi:HlyD family secretion protein